MCLHKTENSFEKFPLKSYLRIYSMLPWRPYLRMYKNPTLETLPWDIACYHGEPTLGYISMLPWRPYLRIYKHATMETLP